MLRGIRAACGSRSHRREPCSGCGSLRVEASRDIRARRPAGRVACRGRAHDNGQVVGALQVLSPPREELPGDGFGVDPVFTERVTNVALWFYRKYWRVETEGVNNVPARGRALLVANHAGIVPYDGAMIRTAIIAEHRHPRHARMLVVDWAFAMPFTNMLLVKTGNVLAHPLNATALLERDELVGVFPEGVRGAAKLYRNRYRIRRLGRGGFVQVALRTGAPIVPVAVVGSEEVHPVLFDMQPLARLLGLPALPITPTFPWLGLGGLVPLPSKWFIAFGEPIEVAQHGPEAADDARLVLELSERVREWIQSTVNRLLARRQTIFF
ncbi:MAG: acyltransferase family protein [Chloroflexi bacterium]|nr:MAG: acyltransferase family protein [Chloroflexota bacterium]